MQLSKPASLQLEFNVVREFLVKEWYILFCQTVITPILDHTREILKGILEVRIL